jgi:hypothetical protein
MSRIRAQVSLELLVVLAAFFAFLVLWLPVTQGARNALEFGIAAKQAHLALGELKGAAEEVRVLGEGSAKTVRFTLSSDAALSYDAPSGTVSISVEAGGRGASFEERVAFPMELTVSELRRGGSNVSVRNAGNAVIIGS